jgi:hypothetical protein
MKAVLIALLTFFTVSAIAQTPDTTQNNPDPKVYNFQTLWKAIRIKAIEEGARLKVSEQSDRRGGMFELVDTTKGFHPDGGVIISVPGTKWAIARDIPDGIVHSKWFATGDSTTNDWRGIQTMLNKYKHIWIDRGYHYHIKDSTISVTLANQLIEGDGGALEQDLGDSDRIFISVKVPNVTFYGVTIIGAVGTDAAIGNYANGRAGIQFEPGANFGTVQNCLIRKQTPIQFRECSHNNVDHNHLYFTQQGVMSWSDSAKAHSDVTFTFNYVHVDTLGGIVSTNFLVRGLKTQNAYDVKAIGNTVLGAQLSIEFFFYNPAKATNYIVTNNIVDTYISLVSGSNVCNDNLVDYSLRPANAAAEWQDQGNVGTFGIEFTAAQTVTCIGNVIKNVPGSGIFAVYASSASSLTINRLKGGVFSGNIIENCGDTTVPQSFPAAISVGNGENIDIIGNSIINDKSSGIGVTGTANRWSTNINIYGNSVVNSKNYGIWLWFVKGFSVKANYVNGMSSHGIMIGNGVTAINGDVQNNYSLNNNGYGIYIGSENNRGVNVINNTVIGNKLDGVAYFGGRGYMGRVYNNIGQSMFHSLPGGGAWEVGDFIPTGSPSYEGKRCVSSGSIGTIFNMKAATIKDSNLVVTNDSTSITEGDYINIAGSTLKYKIMRVRGFNITLYQNADTTLTNADVQFATPVFINQAVTQLPQYRNAGNPNGIQVGIAGSSYIQTDSSIADLWVKDISSGGVLQNYGWKRYRYTDIVHGRALNVAGLYNENLLQYSNTFSNAYWTKLFLSVATVPGITDPAGGTSAWKLTEDNTNNAKVLRSGTVSKSAVALDYTLSFYAKPAGRNFATAYIFGSDGSAKANVDLTNGQIGAFDTAVGYRIRHQSVILLPDGWSRVSFTVTVPATSTTAGMGIYLDSGLYVFPTKEYIGDTSGIYGYHAQFSQTNYAEPDVETGATPIVRRAINWMKLSDTVTYATKSSVDINTANIATNTSNIAANTAAIALKQDQLTLTTTGASGAATLVGATLNIPQYSGGTTYTAGRGIGITSGSIFFDSSQSIRFTGTPIFTNMAWTAASTGSIGSSSLYPSNIFANNINSQNFIPINATSSSFWNNGAANRFATIFNNGHWVFEHAHTGNGALTDVASSALTINSTTAGFLPPRMTTTQRDAIASPATGLIIYNTTTNTRDYYNGTAWSNNSINNTTVTTSTFTVPNVVGNEVIVLVNYGAGTATITLPSPSANTNKKVTIKSITTNSVTLSGTIFASDPNTIGAASYGTISLISDGTTFYKIN